MKTRLRFLNDVQMPYRSYKRGDIVEYETWPYEYRGESPNDREKRGLWVFCFGHGCFASLKEGEDVETATCVA